MKITPIRNEKDYQKALDRLESLFGNLSIVFLCPSLHGTLLKFWSITMAVPFHRPGSPIAFAISCLVPH